MTKEGVRLDVLLNATTRRDEQSSKIGMVGIKLDGLGWQEDDKCGNGGGDEQDTTGGEHIASLSGRGDGLVDGNTELGGNGRDAPRKRKWVHRKE